MQKAKRTNKMKIPFYFDNPADVYKFNGIDNYSKQYIYYENQDFLSNIPYCFHEHIKIVDNSYNGFYYYPIYFSWQCFCYPFKFTVSLPDCVLQGINNKKCKILIINVAEGYDLALVENLITDKIMYPYRLDYNNFVTLTGNFDKFSPNLISNVYFNVFENIIAFYDLNVEKYFERAIDNVYSDNFKTHKFICLQRRPKIQRLMLFSELYKRKESGILTMGIGDDGNFDIIDQLEHQFFDSKIYKKYKKQKLRDVLPCEFDVNLLTNNPVEDLNIEKYLDSYLHIVSETYFETNNNQLFFSEKIYKPIVFLQPFIVFGQPYTLKKLQDLKFKTFSSHYIDEDYDNIVDDKERFLFALSQVKKIISMTHTELHDMIKYFREILLHNHHLLKFRNQNNSQKLLIDLWDQLNYGQ
jgi:hypothetical protein